jgi:isocitrate dehydrogenase kinase/phosphatase
MTKEVVEVLIHDFNYFHSQYTSFTSSAKQRFEDLQWHEQRFAMQQRMSLHENSIDKTVATLKKFVDFNNTNWREVASLFVGRYKNHLWYPIAISYYNSVLRQAYSFHAAAFIISLPSLSCYLQLPTTYPVKGDLSTPILQALKDLNFKVPFLNIFNDVKQIVRIIEQSIEGQIESVSINKDLFYRNKHAYAIGSVMCQGKEHPLALAMVNTEHGVSLKAALLSEEEIKNIFAFSRSYFLIDSESPVGTLNFLMAALPSKPKAQLLINMGFQELGKECLLQLLNIQIHTSDQKFDYAPGITGMVMIVFYHPNSNYVFKVVRNNIKPPKNTSEKEVIEKYRFVAQHDRAGRMADVQHFKNLALPSDCFQEKLKTDLLTEAAESVQLRNGHLIFTNLFIERKLVPLNLYVQDHNLIENKEAILDYGDSIKEMVMTNIFPGDLLMKNFGVTEEGKVVFYDYDEVVALSDCRFKKLKKPVNDEDEYEQEYSEPVMDNDIFPEELLKFLVPQGDLRDCFLTKHGELFTVDFWDYWKEFHLRGAFIDLQPYKVNITSDNFIF